ncbi:MULTISPECIES: glycosyltransferase family 2 protein [unclassified Leifsonia]|uniref:glycosyltransferase family 2 protein n=1 Tax=unclassified Leifsonia TaxID=2663824 RepID=UPI0009293638|nr:glycosyltransferase family 2 protein [Leifsonia sp. 71-9]OJX78906.1 MAG: glycosyl transferase family 2 [Leifsonia sp. 71-9]
MSPTLERTLIVMPAFNEEASVAAVVAEVRGKLPGVSCLVVDDGSTDRTSAEATAAGARVARLPFNMGVGGAMRLGFQYAMDNDFDVVVQLDADGQHDPASVPALVAALAEADIAIGARFSGEGEYSVRGPRRWAMKLLSSVLSRIVGTKLRDTTSGFKANGPRAVELFAHAFPAEYLGDTVEALVIAARANLRVAQVPVSMRPRSAGTPSHNPIKSAVYLARAFLALVVAVIRPRAAVKETSTA